MNRKRMSFVLALIAALLLASLGWLLPLSKNSQAAPVPSSDASFKGKVLLVNMSNMMSVFLLEKAQVQKIGERSWLTGKGAAVDSRMGGWYKGRTVRLRMEHIGSITEFDDLKDAKKALESGASSPFGTYSGVSAVPAAAPIGVPQVIPGAPAAPVPAPAAPVPPPTPAR